MDQRDAQVSSAPRAAALKSMTGFADAAGSHGPWSWTMELRGVNGRGLDLRVRAPDWIEGFEQAARKALQAALGRGSVTLNLRVQRDTTETLLELNEAALTATLAMIARVEEAAEAQNAKLGQVSAAEVLSMRGVVETRDDAGDTGALRAELERELAAMILAFEASREAEGAALRTVLDDRIAEVARLTDAARDAASARTEQQKRSLEEALARLLDATQVPDEGRLLQEMAIIAVKSDISEELDRLDAHIGAARALLDTSGPVGRKFDFLMQEFNREANTLCSKAQSKDLTAIGLDLKTVIDQMREQVQNIE